MKIVVTGATSFVGLGAVRELLHRGHQVYAVLREHSTKADLLLSLIHISEPTRPQQLSRMPSSA